MAYAAPAVVDRPGRTGLPYGLFSVVDWRTDEAGRWQAGIEWQALTCTPASGIGDPDCEPGDTSTGIGLPKTSSTRGDIFEGTPFTVYHRLVCSPVGFDPATAQADATAALVAREQARVEQAFWLGDLGNTPNIQEATVLPTDSQSPAFVLGTVEAAVRDEYGSLGVIHVGEIGASVLARYNLIELRGSRLTTILGTPVVVGAGYAELAGGPTLGAAPPGSVWIAGTSALFGYRSDVFTSTNRPGDLLDRGVNNMNAVAERMFVLGAECVIVAATMEAFI